MISLKDYSINQKDGCCTVIISPYRRAGVSFSPAVLFEADYSCRHNPTAVIKQVSF
jgi:hypothetical protein